MRTWLYDELDCAAPMEMTDQEVLDFYWEDWKASMIKKYGEGHELITEENCIQDWVTVMWAWEKKDGQ